MPTPWSVRHRDGWCAVSRVFEGREPPEALDSVPTRCGYYVTAHWGIERRKPDCIECAPARSTTQEDE